MNLLHVKTLLTLLLLFVPLVVKADKKVACYYGSWSRDRFENGTFTPADINSSLCSHLIYAFASLGTTNRIQLFNSKDNQAYRYFVRIKKQNPKVKVLLFNNKPQTQKPLSRYEFKLFQQINSMATQDKSQYVNSCLDILF